MYAESGCELTGALRSMSRSIKEQQLDLFADRTSAATYARQLNVRLYLGSSAAYMLMHALASISDLILTTCPLARARACQTMSLEAPEDRRP